MAAESSPVATVLCVGQTTVDHVFTLTGAIEAGRKHIAADHSVRVGGVAATAALAVARLGGAARLSSRVGDDPDGSTAIAALRVGGVDVDALERVTGGTTPISSVLLEPDGARTVINHTSPGLFDHVAAPQFAWAHPPDATLVDGRWPEAAIESLRRARRSGSPGVVDVDRRVADASHEDAIFESASHLLFSDDALRASTGCDDPVDGLRAVARRTDAVVAVTRGPEGVQWLHGGDVVGVDAFDVVAVDTNGAGDVFHGAFALALAEGGGLDDAFRFASAAAALKCATGHLPDRARVASMLRQTVRVGS
jgi:sulfofructose kinase